MLLNFLKGLVTFIFAFSLGFGAGQDKPADSELQQKVQDHMDVIVDESAAIVDDVMDEARKNEKVQEAEEFIDDVHEIMDNTMNDIHEHFGDKDEAEETEAGEEAEAEVEAEAAEEVEEEAEAEG